MTIKNTYSTIILTVLAIAVMAITPIGSAKNKIYQTNIKFNPTFTSVLNITNPLTVVTPGISDNSLNEVNQNPNPENIKSFMCAIAPDYGVDWKLVYAIGYHESGNFASSLARRNNNYFGRKAGSGGYAAWATPEDGIRNQFAYIKNNYYNRGLTTPAAINPIYAEDSSWQYAVTSVMRTL